MSGTTIISGTGTSSNPFIVSNSTTAPTPTPAPTTPTPKQENSLNNVIRKKHNIEDPKTTPGKQISNATEAVLAAAPDDYGTSYYFRGNVKDNYVIFANKCWRIVRITGNGAVKLVLHNDNTTGAENPCASVNNDSAGAFAKYDGTTYKTYFNYLDTVGNSMTDYNSAIGFMYGTFNGDTFASAQKNTNKSTILKNLESWYKKYFLNKEYEKVLADTIWCNDKGVVSNTSYQARSPYYSVDINYGGGKNQNYYKSVQRIIQTPTAREGNPTLICQSIKMNDVDKNISKFTADDIAYGNGNLQYKVGLLTSDEVVFAGGVAALTNTTGNNTSYYLYENANSEWWWTLSPFAKNESGAYVFSVSKQGQLDGVYVGYNAALRPAVSLVAETTILGGDGTSSNPYIISNSTTASTTTTTEAATPTPKAEDSLYNTIRKYYPNIKDSQTTPGTQISNATEAVLAAAPDDYGISYYFRGAIDNNYVQFANKCWRIVRITGNGAVKLVLHNDNTAGKTSPCASVNNDSAGAFAKYDGTTYKTYFNYLDTVGNSMTDYNSAIGFMYGTFNGDTFASAQKNTNKSTILKNLESWYKKYFLNKEYEKVLADTIWCNDKGVVSNTSYQARSPYYSVDINYGGGKNQNYYKSVQRIIQTPTAREGNPTLICQSIKMNDVDKNISKFTADDIAYGNGNLQYKVGLLTSDEVVFAGGVAALTNTTGNNTSYYLYENANSEWWWTLSPFAKNESGAYVFSVSKQGQLDGVYVAYNAALRPAVSLVADVKISGGTGTSSDPFVIVGSES